MKWSIFALVVLFLSTSAWGDLVVDVDLGVIGPGGYPIVGNTSGAGNEASNYPPFTSGNLIWIEDVVFKFTVDHPFTYTLFNDGIVGDPDFFLLDSLETMFNGVHHNATDVVAVDYLDGVADGISRQLPAGTYYISVDAYGGILPGNSTFLSGPFNVTLIISDVVAPLGQLQLDDGLYARGGSGPPDHPYGELEFSVDATGTYSIHANWLISNGSSFNGAMYLFNAPFTENDSINTGSDVGLGGSSQIDSVLIAGQTYYLVGTSFNTPPPGTPALLGDIMVSGSGNVTRLPQTVLGPLPYLQTSDSAFFADIQAGIVMVETFEDSLLNIPGVLVSAGAPLAPGINTDSVDADDGLIDGNGNGGWSFLATNGAAGITFDFEPPLPTSAGIVWTDGAGIATCQIFDQNGLSLGTFTGHPAGIDNNQGQTGEDRFFGASNPGGISAIVVGNSIGGMEVDHLQFGGAVLVPGDINGDGLVNLLDVGPFVAVLSAGTYSPAADINQDGVVNLLDIGPFVALLTSG